MEFKFIWPQDLVTVLTAFLAFPPFFPNLFHRLTTGDNEMPAKVAAKFKALKILSVFYALLEFLEFKK